MSPSSVKYLSLSLLPQPRPGSPPPAAFASRAGPGGRGKGSDYARVPLKSRETRLPPLPPPLTSFPLTSRRCCSKNKGRGHRSHCREGLGSQEPRPTPFSFGATYGNASSSILAASACALPDGQGRPGPFRGRRGVGPSGSRVEGSEGPRDSFRLGEAPWP